MPSSRVDWQFTPATSRWLRLLTYLAVGLTAGPVLGLCTLVALLLVTGGEAGLFLLVLAAAIVAGLGVGSGRALFALTGDERVTEGIRGLSKRWLVGSVLVGALGAIAAFRLTDTGFELLVGSLVVGFGALVAGAGLRTEGVVETVDGVITYRGRTIPLDAVARLRSLSLGPFVVTRLGYHDGAVSSSTPRVLVLSSEARDAVDATLETTPESPASANRRESQPAVKWVAAAFGVGCLTVGPVLWFVLPDGGQFLAWYLGAFGLLFGAVFLRYAVVA